MMLPVLMETIHATNMSTKKILPIDSADLFRLQSHHLPEANTFSRASVELTFNNTRRRALTAQFMGFTEALHYSPSRYREFE